LERSAAPERLERARQSKRFERLELFERLERSLKNGLERFAGLARLQPVGRLERFGDRLEMFG
jgi:hypothetical protein